MGAVCVGGLERNDRLIGGVAFFPHNPETNTFLRQLRGMFDVLPNGAEQWFYVDGPGTAAVQVTLKPKLLQKQLHNTQSKSLGSCVTATEEGTPVSPEHRFDKSG
ncbi:hypothetical protein C8A03DRAFT_35794 [Achaetomium macrosporum]|uniref:Uncharacterized protein n=1 Tax=Achaetomium macrosporum TaxID=79813 RepID=A0AAN7C7R8_9PEZI|nr:hypothetical protein C8A03DRAFT_35794 [Achaetomium macrosporum]